MQLLISEVLDKYEAAKTKEEKIAILRQNETPMLKVIMRLNYDPKLKMDLPEGEPPYKKEKDVPAGHAPTTLLKEYRKFYIWFTPQPGLTRFKKESLFVELLESIHHTEAEVLVLAKDGKLHKKYKSLKKEIVKEAYPNTISEEEKPVKEKPLPLE